MSRTRYLLAVIARLSHRLRQSLNPLANRGPYFKSDNGTDPASS